MGVETQGDAGDVARWAPSVASWLMWPIVSLGSGECSLVMIPTQMVALRDIFP